MDVMEWEIKGTSPEYLAIIEDIQNIDRTYRKNRMKGLKCPEGRFSCSQLDKKDRENRPYGFSYLDSLIKK
jgi:hypothetical protein